MKKKLLFGFLVCMLVVLPLLGACASTAPTPAPAPAPTPVEPIKLRYGSPYFVTDARSMQENYLLDWVEKESGGKVQFERFPGGLLGSAPEVYKLVSTGAIDIGPVQCHRFYDLPLNFLPIKSVAGDTQDMALDICRTILAGDPRTSAILRKEWEDNNLMFLGDIGFSVPGSAPEGVITRSVASSLADLKGKKIGGMGSSPEFGAMGITWVSLTPPDMYESVARGVVDGLCGTLSQFVGEKDYEPCKGFTTFGLWSISGGGFMAMNSKTWKSLPPDIQAVFDKGVKATQEWAAKTGGDNNTKNFKVLTDYGLTVGQIGAQERAAFLKVRNESRKTEYLDICKKAGKLAEAELMIQYCDEILSKMVK